jgi:hypothetical protein
MIISNEMRAGIRPVALIAGDLIEYIERKL